MQRHSIVVRRQAGKSIISSEGQELIKRRVTFFFGRIAKELQSGRLNDEDLEDTDETHFIINFDDGKTFGFRGDVDVKYANATTDGECMTMMVRISGGEKSCIENPFLLFKNKDRNYPVRGVPDSVPDFCYGTGSKE